MNNLLKIKIKGLNLIRIIDWLINKGVIISNLIVRKNYIIFNISDSDVKFLKQVCEKERKKYIVIYKFSVNVLFKKLASSFGLILSAIILFCYVFAENVCLYKVNVLNDSNYDYNVSKIYNYLNDIGVKSGVNRFGINLAKVEDFVEGKFDDISRCVVDLCGGNLTVKIYPEKEKFEPKSNNLKSKYDAVVSDIEVFAGRQNCNLGDIVKPGDDLILFDGFASGKVRGKVYFSDSILYNEVQQNKVYTGNFYSNKTISIFNKNLIKQQNISNYSNYLTKKCDFYLINAFIPIKCEEVFYFEYDIIEEVVKYDIVEDKIKEELLSGVRLKIPNDAEELAVNYSVVKEGNLVRVDCIVETVVDLI